MACGDAGEVAERLAICTDEVRAAVAYAEAHSDVMAEVERKREQSLARVRERAEYPEGIDPRESRNLLRPRDYYFRLVRLDVVVENPAVAPFAVLIDLVVQFVLTLFCRLFIDLPAVDAGVRSFLQVLGERLSEGFLNPVNRLVAGSRESNPTRTVPVAQSIHLERSGLSAPMIWLLRYLSCSSGVLA